MIFRRLEQNRIHAAPLVLAAIAALALASGPLALVSHAENLLYNANDPLDVDGNHAIQVYDALLVINELIHLAALHAGDVVPMATTQTLHYWDTNNDGHVTDFDALLVINYLITTPAPEPSSVIMAAIALVALGGYVWRRRRLTS